MKNILILFILLIGCGEDNVTQSKSSDIDNISGMWFKYGGEYGVADILHEGNTITIVDINGKTGLHNETYTVELSNDMITGETEIFVGGFYEYRYLIEIREYIDYITIRQGREPLDSITAISWGISSKWVRYAG